MTNAKKAIIAVVVLALCGVFVFFAVRNANAKQSATGIPKNAMPVELEEPKRETIVTKVSAKGMVELLEKEILYPETQARIQKVNARVGDLVSKGQVLVEYDAKYLETLNNQLADAQLSLKAAKLGLAGTRLTTSAESEILQSDASILQAEKAVEDIQAQIDQQNVGVEQIKENIRLAELKANNTRALFDQGVVAKSEVDAQEEAVQKLKDQLETAEAQIAMIRSSLPAAQRSLDVTREQRTAILNRNRDNSAKTANQASQQAVTVEQAQLKIEQLEKQIADFKGAEVSPVAGTVIGVSCAEGGMSVSGQPLMELADLSNKNLVIKADVPESSASGIAVGQEVEISGDALAKGVYKGQVTKIYPLAQTKQVGNAMETVITIEIAAEAAVPLRPGYTIQTGITTHTFDDVMVVPLMSTLTDEEGAYVFVMKDDFTVEKRRVTLGAYSGMYVQADGVNEGEKLIVSPSPAIAEGMYVKPTLSLTENPS